MLKTKAIIFKPKNQNQDTGLNKRSRVNREAIMVKNRNLLICILDMETLVLIFIPPESFSTSAFTNLKMEQLYNASCKTVNAHQQEVINFSTASRFTIKRFIKEQKI